MKQILFVAFIISMVGCSKKSIGVAQLDPNKQYFMKYVQTNDQVAKLNVRNDTLRISFNEKIVFLVDPNDYANSWAMHLTEDFSKSYLNGLHFDALATAAGYAHDWIPVNLNDAAPGQKISTNVTVDGKKYVQVSISRTFEFFNKLGTREAALSQQNTLLQTTNDVVTYKAFYSDGSGYSKSNDGTFKIIYSNQ